MLKFAPRGASGTCCLNVFLSKNRVMRKFVWSFAIQVFHHPKIWKPWQTLWQNMSVWNIWAYGRTLEIMLQERFKKFLKTFWCSINWSRPETKLNPSWYKVKKQTTDILHPAWVVFDSKETHFGWNITINSGFMHPQLWLGTQSQQTCSSSRALWVSFITVNLFIILLQHCVSASSWPLPCAVIEWSDGMWTEPLMDVCSRAN